VKWRSGCPAIARQAIETKARLKVACCQFQKLCFGAWLSAILSAERGDFWSLALKAETMRSMVTPPSVKREDSNDLRIKQRI
jgi:hypothetical protein